MTTMVINFETGAVHLTEGVAMSPNDNPQTFTGRPVNDLLTYALEAAAKLEELAAHDQKIKRVADYIQSTFNQESWDRARHIVEMLEKDDGTDPVFKSGDKVRVLNNPQFFDIILGKATRCTNTVADQIKTVKHDGPGPDGNVTVEPGVLVLPEYLVKVGDEVTVKVDAMTYNGVGAPPFRSQINSFTPCTATVVDLDDDGNLKLVREGVPYLVQSSYVTKGSN